MSTAIAPLPCVIDDPACDIWQTDRLSKYRELLNELYSRIESSVKLTKRLRFRGGAMMNIARYHILVEYLKHRYTRESGAFSTLI